MKKNLKSPFLIALIAVSMIASSLPSSSAFGATTPAQDQAAAKAKAEAEAKAKAEAEARAKAQAEAQAQAKAQAEAQARAQAQAQAEAQRKAQADAQARAQADAQARAQAQAQAEAQRKAQAEAQAKAQQDAQAKAQAQAQAEAQRKAQAEAQAKAQQDAQAKAQAQAQAEAQRKAQADAQAKAASDKAASDKAAQDKLKAEQAAKDKAASDKAASDKAAQDRVKAEQAAKDKAAADKAASDKAAQDKVKAEQAAKDKIAQEAKAKADKAAADKAVADKAAREAQDKANRKPAPQNPVGPPPVIVAKAEDKASVADKLKTAQNQTPAQAAIERAQKDQEAQKIAHEAAQRANDAKTIEAQRAKEEAAQKAADEKAKQIAAQKAQERKAIQVQAQSQNPVVVKTPQQIAEERAKADQERAKAKTRIAEPVKSAEVKQAKEVKAAEVEVAAVQKKEVVAVQKQREVIVLQKTQIIQASQNPNQTVSAAQAKVIEHNKKEYENRQARREDKPVIAAPVHSAPVVELKVVGGVRIGFDPNVRVKVVVPVKIIEKPVIVVAGVAVPSHMANHETQQNIHDGHIRSEEMHNRIINKTDVTSVTITKNITHVTNVYVNNYQNVVVERSRVYNNYYNEPTKTYRQYYSSYYDHGFRGGYAYPVRVDIRIHEHFWNPLVLWMFDDSDNHAFYCQYYGDSYCYSYPIRPFRYARVFYPTDTMRDLAIEVSGMSYYRHTYYRTALEVLTDKLNAQISNYVSGRFYFGPNDIVINHYRNLGGGQVMVEGFVDRGSLHVAFKGRLDLESPYNSDVFVPTVTDYSPVATGIAILNAIVALEQAADVREHVSSNIVYEEPAPPPMPVVNVTCRTFSGDLKFVGVAPDSGTASQRAINHCTASTSANATECKANLSCDDGISYAPVVSCSTSSTDADGNPVTFIRKGRDADYASQMAQQICIADDATTDVDACSSPDNVTCVALDNSVLNPMMCSVTVPNVSTSFNFQSFDTDKARNRAISNCVTADGTDVNDCSNTDFLSCDYVNAPPPPPPPPPPPASCVATGPNGKQYPSGPASDLKSAYNIAVKACARANPNGFGVCESTAIANCPGAK